MTHRFSFEKYVNYYRNADIILLVKNLSFMRLSFEVERTGIDLF